jgi:hypothetical protein
MPHLLPVVLSALIGEMPAHNDGSIVDELKSRGLTFRKAYFRFVLEEDCSPEDIAGHFVTIDERWKGSLTDLRLLNKLDNLREVSFAHPKSGDDWCAGLTQIASLEGVYLTGNGSRSISSETS